MVTICMLINIFVLHIWVLKKEILFTGKTEEQKLGENKYCICLLACQMRLLAWRIRALYNN